MTDKIAEIEAHHRKMREMRIHPHMWGSTEEEPPPTIYLTGSPETRRFMQGNDILIEMKALDAEMIAMQEANIEREEQGYSHAYGSEHFFEMAEKYRKLKEGAACQS